MSGFFGAVSKRDVVLDVFFGTDYHSHLGTKCGGMVVFDPERGFQRQLHSIETTPFRSKFERDLDDFSGSGAIGSISDDYPQPLLVKAACGTYAISSIGLIENYDELIEECFRESGRHFMAMSSGMVNTSELVAMLINQKDDLCEGIQYAREKVRGTMLVLILTDEKKLIVARDKVGRLPVLIGKDADGYCVSFESFAYQKLGYQDEYELGPGEIVEITQDGYRTLLEAGKTEKLCGFLFTYFGYPNSDYDGRNVELVRYRNGALMAKREMEDGTFPDVDYVAGMPDSGTPHAIGYANCSGKDFARPYVKYTPTWPRSFLSVNQAARSMVAKMKQIPVKELMDGKKILFVDDSIVRGTQLQETVDFLYRYGAKEVHMRAACPPLMYKCKYLNFSRAESDYDMLTRKVIRELEGEEGDLHIAEYADPKSERHKCMLKAICEKFGFTSLRYQTMEDMAKAIGLEPDQICTYCWMGHTQDQGD